MGAKVHNIDDAISTIGTCLTELENLISVTNSSMLDDSNGTLDELKTLLTDTKSRLETSKKSLETYNQSLKNNYDNKNSNPDDYRWYLREDGYDW